MDQILFEWAFASGYKNCKICELNLKLKDELGNWVFKKMTNQMKYPFL